MLLRRFIPRSFFLYALLAWTITPLAGWAEEQQPSAALAATDDVIIPVGDLKKLHSEAERRGWRTERDANGDLLLYPPQSAKKSESASDTSNSTETPQTAPQSDEPSTSTPPEDTSDEEDIQIPATDLNKLEQALQKRGWQTRRTETGDLIFYRPKKQAAAVAPSVETGCLYTLPKSLGSSPLTPPIDSWQKAHDYAQAWLKKNDTDGLTVGKIRRVQKLYIVSLVAATQPYQLQRQLVIYIPDGRSVAVP